MNSDRINLGRRKQEGPPECQINLRNRKAEIVDKITKAMDWQSMETAPRDGTPILALRIDCPGEPMVIVRHLFGTAPVPFVWSRLNGDEAFLTAAFSHWMRPPAAIGEIDEIADNIRVLLSALADVERERDELRAKLAEAVKVIEWCLARDERNGSLPEAYADKLGAFIASMKGGEQNG